MLVSFIALFIALFIPAAHGATLEVALKDRVGTLRVPRSMEVSVAFKGGPETAPVEASWSNVESNTIGIACVEKGSPPEDDLVEQVLLQVGEEKWALAPGSNVRFSCPGAARATVTDLHGATVGTFPGPVVMTLTKAKSRAER